MNNKETNKLTAEEACIASKIDRRGFMGKGATAAATLASLIGAEPTMVKGATPNAATADSIIVLWMAGGMASTETFDPKRYTPFAPGVRTDKVLSTFPSIDTAVDNIKISQGLERVAKVMDRATLIRSFRPRISVSFCTRATSSTGTPDTFRRSPWRFRTWAQSSQRRWGLAWIPCRHSSPSARIWKSARNLPR